MCGRGRNENFIDMKRIVLLVIGLIISCLCFNAEAQKAGKAPYTDLETVYQKWPVLKDYEHVKIVFQGFEREYFVYLPKGLPKEAPLVVYLHGYSGSLDKALQFKALADKTGEFGVCVPRGQIDPKGKSSWNLGYPFQKGFKVDDVAFLSALPKLVHDQFGTSKDNAILCGMSTGGDMCYLQAIKAPKSYRAITSVAGLTMTDIPRKYKTPIPFMEVHGTEDQTSYWKGDPDNAGGWGQYLAVPAAVSYVVAANGCLYLKDTLLPKAREVSSPATLHRFYGGKPVWKGGPQAEVWFVEIRGGQHAFALADIDTCALIWEFGKRFLK